MGKDNKKQVNKAPIVELLEPRVLFSADSLSLLGGALLHDEMPNTQLDFDFPDDLTPDEDNTSQNKNDVVFIDSRVPELQSIVDDINANSSSSVTIVIIDQSESGVDVVNKTLSNLSDVDTVHLISHGIDSSVQLGKDVLSNDSLDEHAPTLSAWGNALNINADVLIYGCELGSNDDGLRLMSDLAELIGADVAASSDDTGHERLGGDWSLEQSIGQIESDVIVSEALQDDWNHLLAPWDATSNRVLEVSSTLDPALSTDLSRYTSVQALIDHADANTFGIYSLREAIIAINNEDIGNPNPDNITIVLSQNQYSLTLQDVAGDEDASMTGDLDITHKNVTIIGLGGDLSPANIAGMTTTIQAFANVTYDIDGNVTAIQHMRVMEAHSTTLTLEGLGLTGGLIDDAGAGLLLNDTTAVLNEVFFRENNAMNHSGGGLFSFNNATSTGGVGLIITDAWFHQNDALKGGGLRIQAGESAEFTNVEFHLNTAIEEGGALYAAADITIADSYLYQNSAESGGAIYVSNKANVSTANTTIFNNEATKGGGVYIEGIFSLNDNSVLDLNKALTGSGGGAYLASGTVIDPAKMYVTQSTIISNTALAGSGGGVTTASGSTLDIHDSIIRLNLAASNITSTGGGGLHVSGGLEVTNSTFDQNRATRGAGIRVHGSDNQAIINSPVITNSTFFNNHADIAGGAIHVHEAHLYLENVTLASNTALNDVAGAISVNTNLDSSATLRNSVVSENTFGAMGGYQLDEGVVSAGFNVITRNSNNDQEIHFEQVVQISDIMQIDDGSYRENYVVDAKLASALAPHGSSHSEHLTLGNLSDAKDAGAGDPTNAMGAPRTDGYGFAVNEFVDAGAVESHSPDDVSKLFFINEDDSSVFRVNEDGRALQQIIASPDTGSNESYKDVVYDNKTRQLFLIRLTPWSASSQLNLSENDLIYASVDGAIDPDTYLKLGGDDLGYFAKLDASTSYTAYALSVEETNGPNNNLYIGAHRYATDDYTLFKYEIADGTATWLGSATDVTPLVEDEIANPNKTKSIDVDSDPNSPGDIIVSWIDSRPLPIPNPDQASFYTEKQSASLTSQLNLTGVSHTVVAGVANNTSEDASYFAAKYLLAKHQFAGAAPPLAIFRIGDEQFSDIEYDDNTNKVWFADSGSAGTTNIGVIGSYDNNLGNPSEITTVGDLSPLKLALATVTSIQLPLVASVNTALPIDENALATIDTTYLEHTTDDPNLAPSDVEYTLVNAPAEGTLYLNNSPIAANAKFTQQHINDGELTYQHNGTIVSGATTADDSFSFTVAAPNSTPTSGTFDIEIDVNEAPVVSVTNLVPSVLEDANGAFIANLSVTDIDSPTPTVHVTAAPGGAVASEYVIYDGANLVQNPNASFDYETASSITVWVHAEDDKGLSSTPQAVTFAIGNVNEPPTFTVINQVNNVDENEENFVFGDVVIVDDSPITNVIVTFQAGSNAPSPHIVYQGGKLVQNSAIQFDYENETSFSYTVHAVDQGGLVSAEQTFTVNINDVNEAPTLSVTTTASTMAEAATNTVFGTVAAGDIDSPTPNIFVIDAPGSPTASPYVILSGNDLIQNPAATFDFETMPSFSYTVYAEDDQGLKSAEQTFTVTLTNTNEAPTFSVTSVVDTINENATGIVFGNVTANDIDSPPPNIIVTNVPGGTQPSPHVIFDGTNLIQNPGIVYDHETEPTFSYTVHAIDDQGLVSAEQTFTVTVENVNEAPTISVANQNNTMAESDTGTTFGKVIVGDVDSPAPTIFLVDAPGSITASQHVMLNSSNEIVQIPTAVFDFETMPSFSYTVYAEDDQGVKSAEQTFTVTLTNTNEAPTFAVTGVVNSINENTTGVVFGNVTANDIDSPPPNIIVTNAPGSAQPSAHVIFDGTNLVKNPAIVYDHETEPTFSYTVHAVDNLGLVSAEQTFTVTVNNVNEAPTLSVAGTVSTMAEADTNIVFGTVSVGDVDSPTPTIVVVDAPGSATASPYVIVSGNDLIQNPAATFDFETMPSFSYTVYIEDDQGLKSAEQTFTVTLTNTNEAPTFAVTGIVNSINENATGIVFGNITANDIDSPTPDIIVTHVPGGSTPSPYVIFDGTNLIQNPAVDFDYESTPSFSYTVHAIDDQGLKSAEQTFTVTVNNVNEAPTLTVSSTVSTMAESDTNTVFGTVSVGDVDSPTPAIFVVDAPGSTTPSPYVIFNGTELIQNPAATFDHETMQSFLYTVYAEDDQGLKSDEQTFKVAVTNTNEAPTFNVSNTVSTINENVTNTVFGTVSVADVDSPTPNIVVTHVAGGTTPSPYVIFDGINLVRNPAVEFDYETTPSFSYTVHAVDDQGLKSAEQTFTVTVTNVNEAPTLAVNNTVSTLAESDTNTVFATVSVGDVDSPAPTIFVVDAPGSTTPSPYAMLSGNDIMQNPAATLDFETMQSFSYTVYTEDDQGLKSAEQTFTVLVTNTNEAPTLTVTNTLANIDEHVTNVVFGTVAVNDVDSPTPNIVVTHLPGGTTPSPYVIVDGNDLIQNPAVDFDYEDIQSFSYSVHAVDDQGLVSAEQTFNVTINNVNEAPTFTVANPVNTMTESDTNTVFGTVTPTDIDSPTPNIVVVDAPGSTTASPYVVLNGNDVIQNPAATFDFENMQSFSYTVFTEDDQGLKSEETTYTVSITNTNEAPTFTVSNPVSIIDENVTDAVFGTVTANDVDSPTPNIIVTHLPGSTTPSPYVIFDGTRLVQNPGVEFDYENIQSFSYTVQAVDDQGLVSAEQTFNVTVNNVNEAPTFTVANQVDSIAESDTNTVFGTVTANDVDSPTPNIFVVDAPGSTTASPYVVLSGTDIIQNPAATFDFETMESFSYTVYTEDDQGVVSAAQTFTVAITNTNEAPSFNVTDLVTSVPESATSAVFGTVNEEDLDSAATNIIVTDAPNSTIPSPYVIYQNGQLVQAPGATLDFETMEALSFTVQAIDDEGLTSPLQTFDVAITNVNENPVVEQVPDNLSVSEEQPLSLSEVAFVDPEDDTVSLNLELTGVYVTDPDSDELTYTLFQSTGEPLPEWIDFDPVNQLITIVDAPADIERIELSLIADDGNGGQSEPQPIFIDIEHAAPVLAAAAPEPEPAPEIEEIEEVEEQAPIVEIIEQAPEPEPVAEEIVEETTEETVAVEENILSGERSESIDLASLIKPLQGISLVDLETSDNAKSSINREINITQIDSLETNINWLNLSEAFSQPSDIQFTELANEFDRQREELAERVTNNKTLIGSSFTLSSGLSVGYLLWLIRGGTLMGSVLSSLPAWRLVDPLPVLGSLGEGLDGDEESLESMVNHDDNEPDPDKPTAEAA